MPCFRLNSLVLKRTFYIHEKSFFKNKGFANYVCSSVSPQLLNIAINPEMKTKIIIDNLIFCLNFQVYLFYSLSLLSVFLLTGCIPVFLHICAGSGQFVLVYCRSRAFHKSNICNFNLQDPRSIYQTVGQKRVRAGRNIARAHVSIWVNLKLPA